MRSFDRKYIAEELLHKLSNNTFVGFVETMAKLNTYLQLKDLVVDFNLLNLSTANLNQGKYILHNSQIVVLETRCDRIAFDGLKIVKSITNFYFCNDVLRAHNT